MTRSCLIILLPTFCSNQLAVFFNPLGSVALLGFNYHFQSAIGNFQRLFKRIILIEIPRKLIKRHKIGVDFVDLVNVEDEVFVVCTQKMESQSQNDTNRQEQEVLLLSLSEMSNNNKQSYSRSQNQRDIRKGQIFYRDKQQCRPGEYTQMKYAAESVFIEA